MRYLFSGLSRVCALTITVTLIAACGVLGGEDDRPQAESAGPSLWTLPDPAPEVEGTGETIGSTGGEATFGQVTTTVPAGAVEATEELTVLPVRPLGQVDGVAFGQPVGVEHSAELAEPLTIRWTVTDVLPEVLRAAILVKWNADLEVWEPRPEPLTVEGDTLTAELKEFSFWDWIADVGQSTGEFLGKRAPEPKCSGALPEWVRGTVDPDQDTSAAAIRVCFAPDKDTAITVRVVNNRTFSQRLNMRDGNQKWAWTWEGVEKFDLPAAVHHTARAVFDSPTSFLVPPLTEVAVGIGRPGQPGQTHIRASADVDAVTFFTDVVAALLDAQSIGGLDNPLKDAFLQALFECGGKQLLGRPELTDSAAIGRFVVQALGTCGNEIVRWDSEFGARVERALQEGIRAKPAKADHYAKANRFIHQVARKFAILQAGDIAFYLSDLGANALVGSLSFGVSTAGLPQDLGAWTPDCDGTAVDSNRLYRNLALQDQFADTSKEYWEFSDWVPAARTAVVPLEGCSVEYREELADMLPSDWGDAKAASLVAAEIRNLSPGFSSSRPPCGTVGINGKPLEVTVISGEVSCDEAFDLVRTYYEDPPTAPQGSSGSVRIGEWTCESTTGTVLRDTGKAGECLTDDGRGFRIDRYESPLSNLAYVISPSGNIRCAISSAGADCELSEKDWDPPPRPADCELEWHSRISVGADGVHFVCHGDTIRSVDQPVLEIGMTIRRGDYECAMADDGVTCSNLETGRGFELGRAAYRLF